MQSQKMLVIIIIKAQRDYKPLLKSLSEQGVYPKYIETRKVLYVILTLILIKEVINNEKFTASQVRFN